MTESDCVSQVLSLANNQLTSLPASLSGLTRLKKLNLSHNLLAHLPGCVYSMKALVGPQGLLLGVSSWRCQTPRLSQSPSPRLQVFLHLACNRLENLAENIQALVELKILIVEGNSLHTLPKALCWLTR